MTTEEAIRQLESLRSHCSDFADPDVPDDVWSADIKALDAAIAALRTQRKGKWKYDPVNEVRICTNCGGKVDSCCFPAYCCLCGTFMEGSAD